MENQTVVFFVIACILGAGILLLFSSDGTQLSESSIPPTPAFDVINGTGGNVTASDYSTTLELIGNNLAINFNHDTNEITFNANPASLAFEDLTNSTAGGCGVGQVRMVTALGIYECTTLSAGGETNTASSSGHGNSLVLPKVGVDLPFKGIACTGSINCNINTTDITITSTGGGNATNFADLADVVFTSLQKASIVFYDGATWINKIFKGNSITCPVGQFVNVINNQTDPSCGTPSGSGNMTVLNDAGDANITSPAQLSTLYYVDSQWIDKIFSVNSLTGVAGKLPYSLSNQTGLWTTATIKNPLLDGSNHTDTVLQTPTRGSIIYVPASNKWDELPVGASGTYLKSDGTDVSWQTVTATAREETVALWGLDKTWTNIGTAYVDVYLTANSNGEGIRIDTTGKTTVTLNIMWTVAGAGNNKCAITDVASASNILIIGTNLANGQNTNATQNIPSGLANTVKTYKPRCLSTTSTDDPTWLSGQVLLK